MGEGQKERGESGGKKTPANNKERREEKGPPNGSPHLFLTRGKN